MTKPTYMYTPVCYIIMISHDCVHLHFNVYLCLHLIYNHDISFSISFCLYLFLSLSLSLSLSVSLCFVVFRGVTLERMVNLVATSPRALWGGLTLWGTSSGHRISRDKTMEFILTTYQSFMDPLIFIRLLMHRYIYT